MPSDIQDRVQDLEGFQNPTRVMPKVLHAGDEIVGQPYIFIDEMGIHLVVDKKNVITLNSNLGVSIAGRLSLTAMPDEIAIGGGYFRLNPLLTSCLPSTTPTPIPVLVKATPRLVEAKQDLAGCEQGVLAFSELGA